MRQPSARLDDSCAWRRWPKTSMAASRGCANLLALVEIRTWPSAGHLNSRKKRRQITREAASARRACASGPDKTFYSQFPRRLSPGYRSYRSYRTTIGPLSDRYRTTIGLDSQIVAIGAIGPLSDYYRSYRSGDMIVHYRSYRTLSDYYRSYRTIGPRYQIRRDNAGPHHGCT